MNLEEIESGEYSLTVIDSKLCEITETFFVDIEANLKEPLFSKLLLFPNPTTHSINIKNLNAAEVSYEITNNLGQIMTQGIVINDRIDLENIASGFYQILFRYKKERTRKQFIKMR